MCSVCGFTHCPASCPNSHKDEGAVAVCAWSGELIFPGDEVLELDDDIILVRELDHSSGESAAELLLKYACAEKKIASEPAVCAWSEEPIRPGDAVLAVDDDLILKSGMGDDIWDCQMVYLLEKYAGATAKRIPEIYW